MKKIFIYMVTIVITFLMFNMYVKAEPINVDGTVKIKDNCSHKQMAEIKNCTLTTENKYLNNKKTTDGIGQAVYVWKQKSFKCGSKTLKYMPNESTFYKEYEKQVNKNSCSGVKLYYKKNGDKINISTQKLKGYKKYNGETDTTIIPEESGPITAADATRQNTEERINILTAVTTGQKYTSCEQLLSDGVVSILKKIFLIIQIITPILLIIFTMLDFTKAVASSDKEALNNSFKKFIKRAAIAAAIFLIPTFVTFMLDITGISDGVCGLS